MRPSHLHPGDHITRIYLYRALVLSILDHVAGALVKAIDVFTKEFSKVQRSATLKASSCILSISNEALESITNTLLVDLNMKMTKAQELVRIYSKNNQGSR